MKLEISKKKIFSALIPVLTILVLGSVLWLRFGPGQGEDYWLCENGVWQKHGQPNESKPEKECKKTEEEEGDDAIKPSTTKVWPVVGSVDPYKQSFSATEWKGTKTVTVKLLPGAKIYRRISASRQENLSLADFGLVLKTWTGPKWPFWVKGRQISPEVIEATEVYYTIQ